MIETPCENEQKRLEDLIDMRNHRAIFAEVCRVARLVHPGIDPRPLRRGFRNTLRLFAGQYPGYRACDTPYHDIQHTMYCTLAMARLLHGASVEGTAVSPGGFILGILAALHHDTGYIQKNDEISETGPSAHDNPGTGARFTLVHVDRGISFMEEYTRRHADSGIRFPAALNLLKCTRLDVPVDEIPFENEEQELIGKALGAADLLGQMADSAYLQRLPLLYREFREGMVPGFESEEHLIESTPAFWEFVKKRLDADLGGVCRFMAAHFRTRWGIDRDMYRSAIEDNTYHLNYLIECRQCDFSGILLPYSFSKVDALHR